LNATEKIYGIHTEFAHAAATTSAPRPTAAQNAERSRQKGNYFSLISYPASSDLAGDAAMQAGPTDHVWKIKELVGQIG